MAIGYNAGSGAGGFTVGSATHTQAITIASGSDIILLVVVLNTKGTITGVTHNGVAMTAHPSNPRTYTNDYEGSMWYLVNPATGTNNIVATCDDATGNVFVAGAAYDGVDQSSPLDNTGADGTASADSFPTSITPTVDDCWVVMGHTASAGGDAVTGTIRATALSGYAVIIDSNGAINPAASTTLEMERAGSSSGMQHQNLIVSLAPAGAGGGNVTVTPATESVTVNEIAPTVSAGSGGGGASAPAVDSIGTVTQVSSGTSVSGSFNNVAGNFLLVMVGESVAASSVCTGVTYNGTALVKVDEGRVGTTGRYNTLWAWDIATHGDAPTGSNTVEATFSSSVTFPAVLPMSYSGVKSAGGTGASDTYSADSVSSIENTLTTTADNSLMVIMGRDGSGNRTYTVTEGNLRVNTQGGGYVVADLEVATAGAETFTLSDAGSATTRLGMGIELLSEPNGDVTVTPSTEAVTVNEIAVTVTGNGGTVVTPSTETVTVNEITTVVSASTQVSISVEETTVNEIQPTIIGDGNTSITVNTPQSATVNEIAPTILAELNNTVTVSVETVTFSEITPTLILNDPNVTVILEPEVLTITHSGRGYGRGYTEKYPSVGTTYSI